MIIKLLKALSILTIVLCQYLIVILNLNQYWKPFQSFIELEFYEEPPTQEELHDKPNLFI